MTTTFIIIGITIVLFESGVAKLTTGTPEDMARFFDYFESPSKDPVPSVRNNL